MGTRVAAPKHHEPHDGSSVQHPSRVGEESRQGGRTTKAGREDGWLPFSEAKVATPTRDANSSARKTVKGRSLASEEHIVRP